MSISRLQIITSLIIPGIRLRKHSFTESPQCGIYKSKEWSSTPLLWITRQLSYQSIWIKAGYRLFFRVHPWHHYCLLFRAIQLLLLFPVFSVRLRTVLFLLRIRSDIFSGYYMRLRHLRYRFCFHLCTTLSLSVWTALHIFSLLPVTADCTGWYNFLPKVTRMRRAIIQNQKHYLQIIQIPTHPITSAQKRNAFPARPLPDFVSPSKNLLSFLQKSV